MASECKAAIVRFQCMRIFWLLTWWWNQCSWLSQLSFWKFWGGPVAGLQYIVIYLVCTYIYIYKSSIFQHISSACLLHSVLMTQDAATFWYFFQTPVKEPYLQNTCALFLTQPSLDFSSYVFFLLIRNVGIFFISALIFFLIGWTVFYPCRDLICLVQICLTIWTKVL